MCASVGKWATKCTYELTYLVRSEKINRLTREKVICDIMKAPRASLVRSLNFFIDWRSRRWLICRCIKIMEKWENDGFGRDVLNILANWTPVRYKYRRSCLNYREFQWNQKCFVCLFCNMHELNLHSRGTSLHISRWMLHILDLQSDVCFPILKLRHLIKRHEASSAPNSFEVMDFFSHCVWLFWEYYDLDERVSSFRTNSEY